MLRSAGSSVGSALHPQGSQARSKPAGSMARPQPGLSYPACSGKLAGSDAEDGADAPAAVPLDQAAAAAGGATNGAANGTAHCTAAAEGATDKAANGAVPSRGPSGLLPSPFEAAAPRAPGAAAAPRPPGAAAGSSQRPSAELPGQGRLMLYQRSMLRLRSSITRQAPSAQRPQDQALAAVEEGRSGEQAAGAPSGEHASSSAEAETLLMGPSEAAQPGAGGGGGSLVCPGSPAGGGPSPELSWHWANKAIRVTSR